MCTLEEDEFGCHASECENRKRSDVPTGTLCGKCGVAEAELRIPGRNVYCGACFVAGSIHKFRATLGKHKAIRKGDSVLIGYSGKGNATVLLHFIRMAMDEPFHKKLIFQPILLYIDDGAVKGRTIQERCILVNEISDSVRSSSVTGFAISLGHYFTEKIEHRLLYPLEKRFETDRYEATLVEDNVRRQDGSLLELFQNLEDDTAKDELLRNMRRILLLRIARLLDCEKLLLADTSMDLAVKVLADISTGRGATVSMSVAFLDNRSSNGTILRPMRDFTKGEIECALSRFRLSPIFPDRWNSGRGFPRSVRSTAVKFLEELDKEFHGTVAAIYKTSNKLLAELPGGEGPTHDIHPLYIGRCAVCGDQLESSPGPLTCSNSQLSALQATTFSRITSSSDSTVRGLCFKEGSSQSADCNCTKERNGRECGEDINEGDDDCCSKKLSMEDHLCYGCKAIFRTSKPSQSMQQIYSLLTRDAFASFNMQRMRNDIQDFLL